MNITSVTLANNTVTVNSGENITAYRNGGTIYIKSVNEPLNIESINGQVMTVDNFFERSATNQKARLELTVQAIGTALESIKTIGNTFTNNTAALNSFGSQETGTVDFTAADGAVTAVKSARQLEADVDGFVSDNAVEHRFVNEFTIGGSIDYLYPVWWTMPIDKGLVKIEIYRQYSWNGGDSERPLDSTRPHQAFLLLNIEANGYLHDGSANFCQVKRYNYVFNRTAHDVQVGIRCFNPADPTQSVNHNRNSGLYLRGGGLTYRISSNESINSEFYDGDENALINRVVDGITYYPSKVPFTSQVDPVVV